MYTLIEGLENCGRKVSVYLSQTCTTYSMRLARSLPLQRCPRSSGRREYLPEGSNPVLLDLSLGASGFHTSRYRISWGQSIETSNRYCLYQNHGMVEGLDSAGCWVRALRLREYRILAPFHQLTCRAKLRDHVDDLGQLLILDHVHQAVLYLYSLVRKTESRSRISFLCEALISGFAWSVLDIGLTS